LKSERGLGAKLQGKKKSEAFFLHDKTRKEHYRSFEHLGKTFGDQSRNLLCGLATFSTKKYQEETKPSVERTH